MAYTQPYEETYVQLETANQSGELQKINLGGTAAENQVATMGDIANIVNWAGVYSSGTAYYKNDLCFSDGWLAIAIVDETAENFVPTVGTDIAQLGPDTLATKLDNLGTVVQRMRVEYSKDQVVNQIDAYIEDVSSYLQYTLVVTDKTTDTWQSRVFPIVLKEVGWTTVYLESTIVRSGDIIEYSLFSENTSSNTSWEYPWIYAGAVVSNVTDGEWNQNPGFTLIRWSYTDSDGLYRKNDIDTIIAGSTIRCVEDGNQGVYVTYTVTEVRAPNVDETSFVVAISDSAGTLTEDVVYDLTVTNYEPATTPYDVSADYWLTNQPDFGVVSGGLSLTGVEQTGVENNAYGVRVFSQDVFASDDWQLLAGNGSLNTPTVSTASVEEDYSFVKVQEFIVPSTTYTEVARLEREIEAGVYELKMSFTHNLNNTNRSSYFRFSLDGGTNWKEFITEPKDNTDCVPLFYAFPKNLPTGPFSFVFEARKESAGDILNIHFLDLILERKV